MLATSLLLVLLAADPLPAARADGGSTPVVSIGRDGGILADTAFADGGLASESPDAGVHGYVPPPGGEPPLAKACTLRFSGNKVLAEEVYRAVLEMPTDACATDETATLVRNRLETFLHRSGYELASVTTAVKDHQFVDITIDEGRLEKIVFRGNFNLNTLRFQIGLNLPYDIFNRPELDRQVAELTKNLGLGRVWYKLIPTEEVKHLGPQVDNLGQIGEIQGLDIVHPQEAYELHIFFTEKVWDTGAWLDLRTSNQDGFEVIGTWQGQDAFLPDDRYRTSVSGGAGLRQQISDRNYYPTFARGYAESIYYLPVPKLRPLVEARAELLSRQRPDLGLESYWNLYVDVLVSGQYEFARKQTIVFGFGARYQDLFGETPWYSGLNQSQLIGLGVVPVPGPNQPSMAVPDDEKVNPAYLTPIRAFRPFAELRINLLFDSGGERPDRRSDLTVAAREFLPVNEQEFGEARAAWVRVIPFGWHDLWLRASGAYEWGDVPFNNEEPVNGHVRNVFSDLYVHKVISGSGEFRFSITRDLFKFSIFNDVSTFGWLKRRAGNAVNDTEVIAVADCIGPGLHALIEGVFQVDAYYALGLTTASNQTSPGAPGSTGNVHFDNGFNLSLQKVF